MLGKAAAGRADEKERGDFTVEKAVSDAEQGEQEAGGTGSITPILFT